MTDPIKEVQLALREMKKLGMRVPVDPDKLTDKQREEIINGDANGMSISEIADLLIDLAEL